VPKVYIVDHQPSVTKQLTNIIHELGYEAQEIPGGQEVIGTASKEAIDLLLLDAELPGMDGYQVLAKLKEARKTAAIPVIMLTGEFSAETESKALRLGANYILPKRVDPGVMRSTIRMTIKEGLTASQAAPVFQLPEEDSADQAHVERKPRESAGDSIDTAGNLEMLEDLFNGGIQLGSLTMIEGTSGSGKSLICQYLTFGAVSANFDVAYYCSKHTTGSLVRQMNSINLGLWQTSSGHKLAVCRFIQPRR
jgi:DNA-binding response OmpR family regulator